MLVVLRSLVQGFNLSVAQNKVRYLRILLQASKFSLRKQIWWLEKTNVGRRGVLVLCMVRKMVEFIKSQSGQQSLGQNLWGLARCLSEPLLQGVLPHTPSPSSASSEGSLFSGGWEGWLKEDCFSTLNSFTPNVWVFYTKQSSSSLWTITGCPTI